MKQPVFVFGSNLAGRHGAGAAKEALKHWGAIYGVGHGRQGDSYAIPTKDHHLNPLSLDTIHNYVKVFIQYAAFTPGVQFILTPVGCGLAGYKPDEIAPMFGEQMLDNIYYPKSFTQLIT